MARQHRSLSAAGREERRRQDRERLENATRELLESDGWMRWLRARATFHSYSVQNTLLIAAQARALGFEPTHVAGFRSWLRFNRCVRKGERAIRILAPMRVKERDPHGEETGERRTFFRTVFVFDVSQTEPLPGRNPIPLEAPRKPLVGDSHAHLAEPLHGMAGSFGYSVSYRFLNGPDGCCHFAKREIAIDVSLAPNARVATLVHELGHALVHQEEEPKLSTPVEELVVESVAYVVCAGAGLDTGEDSVPYLATWQGKDALTQLKRTADQIDRLARRIESAIPPADLEHMTDRHQEVSDARPAA